MTVPFPRDAGAVAGTTSAMRCNRVSVVIPTLGREASLVATLTCLLQLRDPPREILVVDQTSRHEEETTRFLEQHHKSSRLRWLRVENPSIPAAMNIGLREASGTVVLFLDDDIEPSSDLIARHAAAHMESPDTWAVAGQVLQPGEEAQPMPAPFRGRGLRADLEFPFRSTERAWISSVMAGNLSVKRERALSVGGFDENFRGVAYRFETEFCRRLIGAGGKVMFEPSASIRHLRAPRGGTRSHGSHLTSASPWHGMGDYYFALRSGLSCESALYILRRPLREVTTRFHLLRPWYIPVKLIGELRAFVMAVRAFAAGPKYVGTDSCRRQAPEGE